jgi:hypothetical protein
MTYEIFATYVVNMLPHVAAYLLHVWSHIYYMCGRIFTFARALTFENVRGAVEILMCS